jgi:exodeoxyribonuclease V beta subunit
MTEQSTGQSTGQSAGEITGQSTEQSTERLDPLTLPLHGSRLIEASAGTGKTWTIAALYLRLVLGHGGEQGPPRALLPSEILVMTFTKAATRELSDRIRHRLIEAAACFRGERAAAAGDAFLAGLLADFAPEPQRQQAAWRLAMAAEGMDDAAVHTIDAWCQRMLREHAFDSGCLFDEELQADEAAMAAEAARDYWRQQVYGLAEPALGLALAVWPDVDALVAGTSSLLALPVPVLEAAGMGSLADCIARAGALRDQHLADLKRGWSARAAEMHGWLDQQMAGKGGAFNKVKLKAVHYSAWLNRLGSWAADPPAVDPGLTPAARWRLTPAGLQDAMLPGVALELPACFLDFEALMAALPRLPDVGTALRSHAAVRVAERLGQLKSQAGTFGFADLLNRLDRALDPAQGPTPDLTPDGSAQRLRQRILEQYPAALIDEFQDTSPVQLSIFDRIYRIADNAPAQALLLIGDPKQSIYGFRGADIHSYLGVRRATQGRHHVLGTNHRSTRALVAAVNGFFLRAEARPGTGAFGFRADTDGAGPGEGDRTDRGAEGRTGGGAGGGDTADDGDGLPFVAVDAQGRDEHFVASGGAPAAVTLYLDATVRSKADSRERCAALCAERIVTLLNDAGAGFQREVPAGPTVGPAPALQRLRPADIAVLVRTGTEAAAVRVALRRRGLATVYLSDKDSVFGSAQARDLLRLLRAVAAPRDQRLARAALATALVGLPLAELLALSSDEARFDAHCVFLGSLQATWQAQGVLAMIRRALHGLGQPARCLAEEDGERRLTNVLHLAELLQAASAGLDGEQALIRWLAQQVEGADPGLGAGARAGAGAGDEQVLRLESDADLVKVITVHKSKGLEYPLVFLPFAAHFRAVERRRTAAVLLPDGRGARQLVLSPTDEQLAAADRERLREDLRLLYVALTRARHGLWLGVSALKVGQSPACVWHRSALGHLLSGPAEVTAQQVAQDVQALAAAVPGIAVVPADRPGGTPGLQLTRLLARAAPPPLRAAPSYAASFDRQWSVSSYSALVKDATRAGVWASGNLPALLLRDDEPPQAPGAGAAAVTSDQPWHRFPRGASAGNFLHEQLEWLAVEGFGLRDAPALQQALRRRCERQGLGQRADEVLAWLMQVCDVPLPALGTALSGLDRVLPEMEFWLPLDGMQAAAVDALCRQHILPGRPRPPLPERTLRGMLMGFADLVFEQGGRHGVLDYKSNALGAGDVDYTPAAMDAAVLAHRYDVQAALYLLALHRLLQARLGAASTPAQRLHGAVVLFLRGVGSAARGCWHLPAPMALIEALDALLRSGSDAAQGASA